MSSRKETPDVLGEILSTPAPRPVVKPAPQTPAPQTPVKKKAAKKGTTRTPQSGSAKTKSAPQSPTDGALVRWEYRTILFRDFRGLRPRFVNGQEVEDWKKQPLIHLHLDELGAQGWELVSVIEKGRHEREAYLKRHV